MKFISYFVKSIYKYLGHQKVSQVQEIMSSIYGQCPGRLRKLVERMASCRPFGFCKPQIKMRKSNIQFQQQW